MALTEKEKNVLTAGLILAGMFLVVFAYHYLFKSCFLAQILDRPKRKS